MKQYQQACVGGFIQNNKGEVLFVKRSDGDDFMPGFWELPGGGVDFGESPQEALRREIKEEVGITVKVVRPLTVDWYFMEKKDEKIQRVETVFFCTVKKEDVILSHEHSEYAWLTREKTQSLELSDYMRKVVESSWKRLS